jgi:hypothetical protein
MAAARPTSASHATSSIGMRSRILQIKTAFKVLIPLSVPFNAVLVRVFFVLGKAAEIASK